MEAYIILLSIVWGCILFETVFKNMKIKKISMSSLMLLIVFIIFYSIRDNIGYDYAMYEEIVYGGYADDVYGTKGEILSACLLNIANFFDNHYIFFFLVALISFILIIYSITSYVDIKDNIGWSILVFMALPVGFINSLSIQRQFVAVSILLFATKYLIKRSFWKYSICVGIASLFHITSIISILLYVVTAKNFKYKYFLLFVIVGLIVMYGMVNIILSLFPFYDIYLLSLNSFEMGGKAQFILYIFLGMCYICVQHYFRFNESFVIFFKTYIFGLVLVICILPFDAGVAYRLGSVGLLNSLFLMPYFFNAFSSYNRIIIKLIMLIILSMLYIYSLSVTAGTAYVPYKAFIF